MTISSRRGKLAAVLILLAFLCAGVPAARAQGNQLIWAQVPGIPETVNFEDVAMVGKEQAWAVGYQLVGMETRGVAYRLRLQNGRWQAAPEATFPHGLRAISAAGENSIWAAGERGLVVMRDAGGWKTVPNTSSAINTIWMAPGGAQGWAAGEVPTGTASTGPFLRRYSNGQWAADEAIRGDSGGGINDLSFAGSGGWAVGNTNIWRYTAGRWDKETAARPCPGDGCAIMLSDVAALNDQEAWAVGNGPHRCEACYRGMYIMRRSNGAWRLVEGAPFDRPELRQDGDLSAVHFPDANHGWAVGRVGFTDYRPLVLSYRDGAWRHEQVTVSAGHLTGIAAPDATHALAVGAHGLVLSYGYGPQPADPQVNPTNTRCFAETGHCVGGRFRAYWEQNGGLAVFGFPTTPPRYEVNRDTGQMYVTQWFERNRFELHPENAAPYDVLLGRLGDDRLRQHGIDWQTQPRASGPQPGCRWFEQTRRNVCDQAPGVGLKTYWETHGLRDARLNTYGRSLALFGLPLTEARMETNSSGDTVLTQWFERARLEWHPNKPSQYKVLLGLLGNEVR